MSTKALATAERIKPRFVEPMYASAVRELPDSGAGAGLCDPIGRYVSIRAFGGGFRRAILPIRTHRDI